MDFIKKYLIKSVTGFIIFGAFIILSSHFYGEDPHLRVMSEIFGTAIGRTLVFFTAGLILIRLPKTIFEGWLLCFTIALSFEIYNKSVDAKRIALVNKAYVEMEKIAKNLENETTQNLPKYYSAEEYGDYSLLLPLYAKAHRFEEELAKEMIENSQIFEQLPIFTELGNLKTYHNAKNILSNYELFIKNSERKYYEYGDLLEKFIKEAVFEDALVKQSTLKGIRQGRKRSDKLMKGFFSLFYTLSLNMHEMMDFFHAKHESINIIDDRLVFANAEDEMIYTKLDQKIADLIYEEVFLNKKMLEYRQEMIENLRNKGNWD